MAMAKKRITKASKRRLVFFGTISLGVIVYFITSFTYYAVNIYQLKQEEKTLKEDLNILKADEKNLKVEIEKLKDPDYLARYARENFLYSKDGEIVIKLQQDTQTKNIDSDKMDYTYIIFIGSMILLFIVGYTVKKGKRK